MPPTDGSTVLADLALPPRRSRLDAVLTRVGLTGVLARDSLLAAVVLLVTAPVVVLVTAHELAVGPLRGTVLVVAACAQTLPLALRRTRPVLALGLVAACQVAIVAVSPSDLSFGGIPQVVAGYTVGTIVPARRALAVTGVAVVPGTLAAAVAAAGAGEGLWLPATNQLVSGLLTYVVSALVGGAVATRRAYVDLLRRRAAELVQAQQAMTRAALLAERSRMARELHDVAAHHLSGLVVQAAMVERQIDSDPEAARTGTAWIRAQGKETLNSLRSVVGVLREGPGADGPADDPHDAPPPGLDALDGLVRTARSLGSAVDLVREGSPRPLAPLADAAFYRLVQESLSNARQHAPQARVRVGVRFGRRDVALEVVNAPAGHAAPDRTRRADRTADRADDRQGLGLLGMRERAHLVGATLTTGPTPDGGWRVGLALPLPDEPAPAPPSAPPAAPPPASAPSTEGPRA
ncbi:sensor histidine kinase [Jannaschia sp. R86511]|uniref:sensor histidine kinase n=1 Tax=Jannaschia sp. R86511 TaxID=3093853 RepID=UPI0036D37D5E